MALSKVEQLNFQVRRRISALQKSRIWGQGNILKWWLLLEWKFWTLVDGLQFLETFGQKLTRGCQNNSRSHFWIYIYTGCPIWVGDILKSYNCDFDFGVRQFSPSFLWWKNVYISKSGIKHFFQFFKGSPNLAHFSNFPPNENFENESNHRDPLKNLKKIKILQKLKCTHFSTMIKMILFREKYLTPKTKSQ